LTSFEQEAQVENLNYSLISTAGDYFLAEVQINQLPAFTALKKDNIIIKSRKEPEKRKEGEEELKAVFCLLV